VALASLCFTIGCSEDGACKRGSEGCPCFPNGTCFGDLSCASNLCVDIDPVRDGGRGSAPGSGASIDGGKPHGADGGHGAIEQGGACEHSADCAPVEHPCRTPVCIRGICDSARRPEGSEVTGDVTGDCARIACGPGGDLVTEVDPDDVPGDDGDPCTVGVCDGATPAHVPAPRGTAAPASAQTGGDCLRVVCDGEGGLTSVHDDGDISGEPTGDSCTVRACREGSPALVAAPSGTSCGDGLACNHRSECIACSADGMACSASAQCCGGLCDRGTTCATCPLFWGDCDGNTANGCEQSLNTANHCGRCGHNCSGRPFVQVPSCSLGTCGISRCMGNHVDADGVFENGCEEVATVGPNGPYATCAAGSSGTCGLGERCGGLSPTVRLLDVQLIPCSASRTDCFCAQPCTQATDCPAAASGTAEPMCSTYCYLSCASGSCPSGMRCHDLTGLGNARVCVPD
jgi:hypothetical protein